MDSKLNLRTVSLSLLAVCIVVLAPYFLVFGDNKISESPADWGVFGDYVGGIFNSIISLANLLILFYLTTYIAKQDDHNAINQYRFEAYNATIRFFNQLNSKLSLDQVTEIQKEINLLSGYDFLFGEKFKAELLKLGSNLNKIQQHIERAATSGEAMSFKNSRTIKLPTELMSTIESNKKEIIQVMQLKMLTTKRMF